MAESRHGTNQAIAHPQRAGLPGPRRRRTISPWT